MRLRDRLFPFLKDGEIAIYHEFHKPPYGGGNQFLLALKKEFESREIGVLENRVTNSTKAALFNSFNFDFDRVRALREKKIRLVHRVDGPISVYRGESTEGEENVDRRIERINREIADRTVLQSRYSLEMHETLGIHFKSPTIIPNASDPAIFHPADPARPFGDGPLRVIASAWSSNPRKGLATYQWLDENIDPKRFAFTFVGQIQYRFRNARQIGALPSEKLADLLRENDVYLTASEHDPCSNALIEALSCGLPAVYRKSGGHPEIVRDGGLGFDRPEEIPALLDRIARDYASYRRRIAVSSMREIGDLYLKVLLGPEA